MQKMLDFNDPNIQIQMCKFQADIKKARILIKFPCSYFVEWRTINNRYCVSTQNRVKAINQQAIFNQKITFYTQMIYNTKRRQYYSKQTFLILNLVSRSRPDQIKLVGRISIDLADILNRNRYQQMTHMKLNYCSVQSSLLFYINLIDKRKSNLSAKDLDKSAFTYVYQKFSDYFSLNSVNRLIVDENIQKNNRVQQYNSLQNKNRQNDQTSRGGMGTNIQNITKGIQNQNGTKKIMDLDLKNYTLSNGYDQVSNNYIGKAKNVNLPISSNDFDDKLPKFKNPFSKLDQPYKSPYLSDDTSSNQVNMNGDIKNNVKTSNDEDTMSFKLRSNNLYGQEFENKSKNRVGIAHLVNRAPIINSTPVNDSDPFQKTRQGQKQQSLIQKLKQQKEESSQSHNHNHNDNRKLVESDSMSKFSEVQSQSHNNNQQLSSIVDRLEKQKLQQQEMIKSLRQIIKTSQNKKKKSVLKQKLVQRQKQKLKEIQVQKSSEDPKKQNKLAQNNQQLKFQINIKNQNAIYQQQERQHLQLQKRIEQLQNQLQQKQTLLLQKQDYLQDMRKHISDLQSQNQKLLELNQKLNQKLNQRDTKKNQDSQHFLNEKKNIQNLVEKNDQNKDKENFGQQKESLQQVQPNNDEFVINISKSPQIYQQQQLDIQQLLERINELQQELKLYKPQKNYNNIKQKRLQKQQIKQNNQNQSSEIKIFITREPNIYEQQENQILELTKTLQLQQEQLMDSVKRISILQKQLEYYRNSQKQQKHNPMNEDQQPFKISIRRDQEIYEQQEKDLTQMSNRIIDLQEKLGYYSRFDKSKEKQGFQKTSQKIQSSPYQQTQNYAIKVSKGQDIYQDQQRQIQDLTKTVQQLTETIQKMDQQLNMYREMTNNSKTQKQIIKAQNNINCQQCSQNLLKIQQLQEQITNLQQQKFFADSTQQLRSKIEELNNEVFLLKSELQRSLAHGTQSRQQQLHQIQEQSNINKSQARQQPLQKSDNPLNPINPSNTEQKKLIPIHKTGQLISQQNQETQKLIQNLKEELDYLTKENVNLNNSLVILQQQVQEQAETIYVLEQQVGRLSKQKEIFQQKEKDFKKDMQKKCEEIEKQCQRKLQEINKKSSVKQQSQQKINKNQQREIKIESNLDKTIKFKQAVGQIQNLLEIRKPLSVTLMTTISQKLSQLPSQSVKQTNLACFQLIDSQLKKIKAQIMKIRDKPYTQKTKLISLFKPLQNSLLNLKQT